MVAQIQCGFLRSVEKRSSGSCVYVARLVAMWRGRNRMSCTQTIANILPSHSHHAHDLIPAGLASGNGNGRSRHLQKFREEFNAGPVRSSLDRRSSKRNLQRVAEFAGNRVLLRTWMNLDRKANSTVGFVKGNHAFLPSENA